MKKGPITVYTEKLALEEEFAKIAKEQEPTLYQLNCVIKDVLSYTHLNSTFYQLKDNPFAYYVSKWYELAEMLELLLYKIIEEKRLDYAASLFYHEIPQSTYLKKRKR